MTKQIRIYVNGSFQFAVTADSDESLASVAHRAATVMKIGTHTAILRPGLINIRTVGA